MNCGRRKEYSVFYTWGVDGNPGMQKDPRLSFWTQNFLPARKKCNQLCHFTRSFPISLILIQHSEAPLIPVVTKGFLTEKAKVIALSHWLWQHSLLLSEKEVKVDSKDSLPAGKKTSSGTLPGLCSQQTHQNHICTGIAALSMYICLVAAIAPSLAFSSRETVKQRKR